MDSVDSLLQQIQARGERMTIQRRLVIEALCRPAEHLTIADIQQHLKQQGEGQELTDVTIYRVLQWLKDLGLVSQTDMGKSGVVYALVSEPYHHHLICLTCGAVITLDDSYFAALRERLQTDYDFTARIDHMAIYGQCKNCR